MAQDTQTQALYQTGGVGWGGRCEGDSEGRGYVHNPDDHNSVITHLEPDILECKVKWALGSITMNKVEVMEFQLSYFKS